MALLFSSSFAGPFAGLFDDDWGFGASALEPTLRRCASTCAPPLGLLHTPPPRPPPAAAYRLLRHASFAPPTEPEVHVRRTPEGVLAACLLGHGFSSQDISLQLSGRDFTITAFHPGTAHWRQRPAAFRQVLDLAKHIDARHIEAALEGGVLTLFFPYRRQQLHPRLAPTHLPLPAPVHQRPRLVFVHRGAAPATAPTPTVHAAAPGNNRPSMQAAPAAAAATAPSPPACAPPSSKTAPAPCSFRRAHHRWNVQHPTQRRCPEQALFGPPAPAPSSAQRVSPPTQHRQPTARPHRQAAPAPAPARAPAPEPLLRPASPSRRSTIPVHGPASTSPAAGAPKGEVPAAGAPPAQPASSEAAASPAAAGTSKVEAAASPGQAAAVERRQRAAAALARIAAGIGSDSDWEDADGMVSDCSLES